MLIQKVFDDKISKKYLFQFLTTIYNFKKKIKFHFYKNMDRNIINEFHM